MPEARAQQCRGPNPGRQRLSAPEAPRQLLLCLFRPLVAASLGGDHITPDSASALTGPSPVRPTLLGPLYKEGLCDWTEGPARKPRTTSAWQGHERHHTCKGPVSWSGDGSWFQEPGPPLFGGVGGRYSMCWSLNTPR